MSKKIIVNTMQCPRCGADVPIVLNPYKAGWVMASCECNPIGPVYEAPMKKIELEELNP